MSYHVTEPHPHIPAGAYVHSGRGGVGNYYRAPANITSGPNASGPASAAYPVVESHSRNSHFSSGRGGAGNIHSSSERAMFSFDEELARQRARELNAAPVYHVGRGGAGNYARSEKGSSIAGEGRKSVESQFSQQSYDSTRSVSGADRLMTSLRNSISRS